MKYDFHDYQITAPPGTSLLAPVQNKESKENNQLIVLKADEVIGTFEWKEGLVVNGKKMQMKFEEDKKITILP